MGGSVLKLVTACVGCLIVLALGAPPAGAGRRGHDAVNFTNPIYRVREGNAAVADVVRGTHGQGPATADVTTYAADTTTPATPGADYQSMTQELFFQYGIDADDATIPTTNDTTEEPPESFALRLENLSEGMVRAFPSEATVTITDNDGAARTSFQFATQEIFENDRSHRVRVYVIRSGPLTSSTTVHYETHDGSALAGTDFTDTEGDLTFPAGDDFEWIDVPLLNDPVDEPEETFSVGLSTPSTGIIGEPSQATVTINDEDGGQTADSTAPYTAFHQPLDGKTYGARTPFIAFMQDDVGGTGMQRVQLGIRMNRKDGSCRWWNGNSFRESSCKKKRWADTGRGTETKSEAYSDTTVFELTKPLKSSKRGSEIRNYTAYCRGWDKAGNVQSDFIRGQNRNRFEVR